MGSGASSATVSAMGTGAISATDGSGVKKHAATMRGLLRSIELELEAGRELLAEVEAGLDELVRRPHEPTGRLLDSRMRDLSAELGIKDAELTLLNMGVSSMQKRVEEIVAQVSSTRHSMTGQTAAEMIVMMDRLAEELSRYI